MERPYRNVSTEDRMTVRLQETEAPYRDHVVKARPFPDRITHTGARACLTARVGPSAAACQPLSLPPLKLIQQTEQDACLPTQLRMHMVVTLAKNVRTERPITLTSVVI